ncbi:MAG: type II toxin-antitoxin system death-on-curing family toxin [Verrucomicrobia bacterium]|nr:type II toxin-antitoxin system death-on-curing family toxin [Verrucomicrobiota bacterium]MCH8513448.1 type II toxin-antitoxin system death-on-curing family toxin [Kiritimatiellia bacterium]
MKEPVWIPREAVLAMQRQLLSRFGGLDGLRDEGLLDSALNRPLQIFAYGSPDVFDLAAAYAMGLVKNHPFLDGNKRIGFVSAFTFLGLNGFSLQAPEAEAVLQTVALAAGEIGEADYALWLKDNCVERSAD